VPSLPPSPSPTPPAAARRYGRAPVLLPVPAGACKAPELAWPAILDGRDNSRRKGDRQARPTLFDRCRDVSAIREGVFSTAGQIMSERRSSLKPEKACMLTFLRQNKWCIKVSRLHLQPVRSEKNPLRFKGAFFLTIFKCSFLRLQI